MVDLREEKRREEREKERERERVVRKERECEER
jgi:hypothetical protein